MGTNDFVFAVSDGMGGANGDYASHLVAEQMTQLFPKVFQTQAQGMTVYFQDVLNELVSNVHEALKNGRVLFRVRWHGGHLEFIRHQIAFILRMLAIVVSTI